MEIIKLILFLFALANYAYIALLTLQLSLCSDIMALKKEQLNKMSFKRRWKRFRLALRFNQYKAYLFFCISSFIFTFGYMNELAKDLLYQRQWIYVIASALISFAIRLYFYHNGHELEVFKQWNNKQNELEKRTKQNKNSGRS